MSVLPFDVVAMGGGVFGAGRATAIKMFEALGLDFNRLIVGAGRQDSGIAPASSGRPVAKANGAAAGMTLYGADNNELMTVSGISREDDALVITGKTFGTMPMVAKMDAQAARAGLKLVGMRLLPFLVSLPFRKGKADKAKAPK